MFVRDACVSIVLCGVGMSRPIITLITDFRQGSYVGSMKGAILDVHPESSIIDITHEVKSYDVQEAAFTLRCAYPYYPSGAIHVVVVDPGVGSERRGIIVCTDKHCFIGPDNGVFSFVYLREEVRKVIAIRSERYFRGSVSPTFHGRDIFAPVSAWMARGIPPEEFGEPVKDYVCIESLQIQKKSRDVLVGSVIHIDKFGNLITNFSPRESFNLLGEEGIPQFCVKQREITKHYRFYEEAAPDEIFFLVGSTGYYEIAVQRQAASKILDVDRGQPVELRLL